MLVRKIRNDWKPMEFPNLAIGDIVEFANPESLIAEGKVEIVKEKPESKVEVPDDSKKK